MKRINLLRASIFCFAIAGICLIIFLYGCSGGSSSSGHSEPQKNVCQTCTYDWECTSNRCAKFKSGFYRCIPQDVENYSCPGGNYKLPDESGELFQQ